MASAPARSPRSIATSKIISVMPSFISDAAVDAIGPWRWAMALSDMPRIISVASRCRSIGPRSRSADERRHRLEAAFETDHARADVASLAGEHRHADAPAAVERAEQVARRAAARR